ncbi:MAG: hypothetical protein PHF21_03505 [Bacilli bacterium]|nr:hypothetical protein [Bacilli bacterium]
MCLFKKTKIEVQTKLIFPIYLDTMRIKDTLAILNNGITSMYSVTKDITNQLENQKGIKASGDLYKVELGTNIQKSNSYTDKQSEQYERIHTDTSLFHMILKEFNQSNRIKNICNETDIINSNEGDIVLIEGNIFGNELGNTFAKIRLGIEAYSKFDKSGQSQKVVKQLNMVEDMMKNKDVFTNSLNMICKIADEKEILLLLDQKYLIGDTGIELAHGKFKVLGIVYEKIHATNTINLNRDTLFGIFDEETVNTIYKSINEDLGKKLNIPEARRSISGPTLGILPIAIYL